MKEFNNLKDALEFAAVEARGPVSVMISHPFRMPMRVTYRLGCFAIRWYPCLVGEWKDEMMPN